MSLENKTDMLAREIDDLFTNLLEIMWEHISGAYISTKTSSLSMIEHYLIEYLGKNDSASMSELSRIFHITPTTMTSIIDRLVKRNYAKRAGLKEDKRVVLVKLSKQGKNYYQIHRRESIESFSNLISKLPDKGSKFYRSLKELNQSLSFLKNIEK